LALVETMSDSGGSDSSPRGNDERSDDDDVDVVVDIDERSDDDEEQEEAEVEEEVARPVAAAVPVIHRNRRPRLGFMSARGVFECSLRRALRELTDPSLTEVIVDFDNVRGAGNDFPAFVSALQRHGRVERLALFGASFGAQDGRASLQRPDDLRRLFGTVLPAHPSLTTVHFHGCTVDPGYFERLLASPPAPLDGEQQQQRKRLKLELWDTPLNDGAAAFEALATGLRGGIVSDLDVVRCNLDAAGCLRLVQAAADSPHGIGTLHLDDRSVGDEGDDDIRAAVAVNADMFANDTIGRMRARGLELNVTRWTGGGLAALFRQLRTNEGIEELVANVRQVDGDDPRMRELDVLDELFGTYNCTLRSFRGVSRTRHEQDRIDAMLRRNGPVRDLLFRLKSCNYCLEDRTVWPRVLAEASRFPTIVHRILRKGNVDGLSDQMRSFASRRRRLAPTGAGAAEEG
jgi:hypothetical protein